MRRLLSWAFVLFCLPLWADPVNPETYLARARESLNSGRPERAFQVLGYLKFESIRALPPETRAKIYEALVEALDGMKKEVAAQYVRLESRDMLVKADGKPFLVGPVSGIVDKPPTAAELHAFFESMSPDKRGRAEQVASGGAVSSETNRWSVGAAGSRDTVGILGQNMVRLLGSVQMPLGAAGSQLAVAAEMDLLQLGGAPAGQIFRALKIDVMGEMPVVSRSGSPVLSLQLAAQFRTTFSVPATTAFQDLFGVWGAPKLRFVLQGSTALELRAWVGPCVQINGGLDLGNNMLGVAAELVLPGSRQIEHRIFVDAERLRMRPAPLVASLELRRIGLGYRLFF